jgi:hypothetical protein
MLGPARFVALRTCEGTHLAAARRDESLSDHRSWDGSAVPQARFTLAVRLRAF